MKEYLEVGQFVATHGVEGELRLYPWSDEPDLLAQIRQVYLAPDGRAPIKILGARPHKRVCLVKLAGVSSVAQARGYIGQVVYARREDLPLPEGRFFIQDLLGAQVVDAETGQIYGSIQNITHPGRHDVYEVLDDAGKVWLFPAADPFLDEIDPVAGRISVRPIPGMFEEL